MKGSIAAAGSSSSSCRLFLLWLVMVMSWTSTIRQLSALTTAQPPDQVRYTIRSDNLNTYAYYFETNLRPWAEQNLEMVSNFIQNQVLCRQTREHDEVILQLVDTLTAHPSDRATAYTRGNTIVMSVGFIAVSPWFKTRPERVAYFRHTLYHEMTHVWQFISGYTSNQNEPWGLVEGMADYAAAKGHGAGFLDCQPTVDDVWYQGYCYTAKFLLYAEEVFRRRIVCKANLMMKTGYNEPYFTALLDGKPPEVVWRDYLDSLVNPPRPRLADDRRPRHNLTDGHVVVVAATATY